MNQIVSIILVVLYLAFVFLIKEKNIIAIIVPILVTAVYLGYGLIAWKPVYSKVTTGLPLPFHFALNNQLSLVILIAGVLATMIVYRLRFSK